MAKTLFLVRTSLTLVNECKVRHARTYTSTFFRAEAHPPRPRRERQTPAGISSYDTASPRLQRERTYRPHEHPSSAETEARPRRESPRALKERQNKTIARQTHNSKNPPATTVTKKQTTLRRVVVLQAIATRIQRLRLVRHDALREGNHLAAGFSSTNRHDRRPSGRRVDSTSRRQQEDLPRPTSPKQTKCRCR